MISAGWQCLLLWQILISGGAFEQEGSGRGHTSICGRKLYILEGDKSDGCSNNTSLPLYHLPGIVDYSSRFDVNSFITCDFSLHGSQARIFQSIGTTM